MTPRQWLNKLDERPQSYIRENEVRDILHDLIKFCAELEDAQDGLPGGLEPNGISEKAKRKKLQF